MTRDTAAYLGGSLAGVGSRLTLAAWLNEQAATVREQLNSVNHLGTGLPSNRPHWSVCSAICSSANSVNDQGFRQSVQPEDIREKTEKKHCVYKMWAISVRNGITEHSDGLSERKSQHCSLLLGSINGSMAFYYCHFFLLLHYCSKFVCTSSHKRTWLFVLQEADVTGFDSP